MECNLGPSLSVTYDFLALGDVDRDEVQDVLFLYKNTNSSNNSTRSCADEGNSCSVYYGGHMGRGLLVLAPLSFGACG